MSAATTRTLRRDAAANQTRIVEAARQVFAERGVDVPLAEVAQEAGVGLATLTRRFNRVQLVEAVLTGRTQEHLALLEECLTLPADSAVEHYLTSLCTQQLNDRSVCHALTLSLPDATDVLAHREQIREGQLKLIRRARRAGALRPGVVPEDFVLVMEAVNGVIRGGSQTSWRRVLAMLVDGLRDGSGADRAALPPAPDGEELAVSLTPPPRGRRPGGLARA